MAPRLRRGLNPLLHDTPHIRALHVQPPFARPLGAHRLPVVGRRKLVVVLAPVLARARAEVADDLLGLGQLLDGRQRAVCPIVFEIDVDDGALRCLFLIESRLAALEDNVPDGARREGSDGAGGEGSAGAQVSEQARQSESVGGEMHGGRRLGSCLAGLKRDVQSADGDDGVTAAYLDWLYTSTPPSIQAHLTTATMLTVHPSHSTLTHDGSCAPIHAATSSLSEA
jgi:hypothetical protein